MIKEEKISRNCGNFHHSKDIASVFKEVMFQRVAKVWFEGKKFVAMTAMCTSNSLAIDTKC